MVPALVLTAGLATRLRPLSLLRAKAALPVAGVPLITRILRRLADAGVTDAVLNLHHLPHTLTRAVGDGTQLRIRVRYSWEVPVLGSAGGPRRALPLLQPAGTFLIVNGDTLTDVDLQAVLAEHRRSDALVTMAVVANTEPAKYGGVRVDAEGMFAGWIPRGASEPSWHFIGVQVAEPSAFSSVPPAEASDVRSLYLELAAARPGAVRAFRTQATFQDIGTPADYLHTCLEIASAEGVDLARHARVASTARLERTVLWEDVVVADGATVRECVVADGVHIPAGSSWHRMSIRCATGELAPGEERRDGLAVAAL